MEYTDEAHLLSVNYGKVRDYEVRSGGWEAYNLNPVSVVDATLQLLDLEHPTRCLDAGCGLGRFAIETASRSAKGTQVTALDISDDMIEYVRLVSENQGVGVETHRGSIDRLPFAQDSFDLIFCNCVMYHLANIPRGIKELARVLTPDGRLVVLVPSHRWLPELIDWQDRALLRLGYEHNHPLIRATGTDRFCIENAPQLLGRAFRVESTTYYDGTMEFPDVEALLHHYRHTMRYRNAVTGPDGVDPESLACTVRELMEESFRETGRLVVSSESWITISRPL